MTHDLDFFGNCRRCGMRAEPLGFYPAARRSCRRRLARKLNARWARPRGRSDRIRHEFHGYIGEQIAKMIREEKIPSTRQDPGALARWMKSAMAELEAAGVDTTMGGVGVIVRGARVEASEA